jgi:hypothetical protein
VCFEVNREGLPRLNEVQTEVHLCKKPYSTRNFTKKLRKYSGQTRFMLGKGHIASKLSLVADCLLTRFTV